MAYVNPQGQLVDDSKQINPNLGLYATGTDDQNNFTTTYGAQGTPPIVKYGNTQQPAGLQPGVPSQLQLRMTDGSIQTIPITAADLQGHASPQFQAAIQAGGQVINPSTGQPLVRGGSAYGGSLFQNSSGQYVPLQVALGYNYFPGQEQAQTNLTGANTPANLANPGATLNQPRLDPAYGSDPGSQYLVPGYKDPGTPTGSTYTGPPPGGAGAGGGTLSSLLSSGVGGAPNYISDINLPTTPQVSGSFDPTFMGNYESDAARYVNNLGGYYGGNWGQMQAAQFPTQGGPSSYGSQVSQVSPISGMIDPQTGMPLFSGTTSAGQSSNLMPSSETAMMDRTTPAMGLGQSAPQSSGMPAVPQVQATGYNAQTPGSFGALNFLLSGQGFDPATLARMNTTASDAVSREQQGQLSSAKIAAQNAGMADSGASLAQQGIINRQAGDARTQAANQIAIQNAMQGINNLTTGAGMELGRETTAAGMQNQAGQFNAQMANQAALQNAMNEFQAMTQNVNNQQQANATNTQNTFAQNQARAQAQGGTANQIIQNTMAGQLSRNANADFTNTQNLIGQQLNQAQLNRQRQMFNAGMGENRYSQSLGGMLGLAGSANPYAYYGSSASAGGNYNPNLTIPNAVSGISTSLNSQQKTTT